MTYPQGQPWPGQPPMPYYPPGPPQDPGRAPRAVLAVLWLVVGQVVLGLALGLPAAYLAMDEALAQQPPTPGIDQETLFQITFVATVVIVVAVSAVWVLFAVKTVQGRNWARITLLVLCGISVLTAPLNLVSGYVMDTLTPLGAMSSVIGLGLNVLVAVLLFSEPAKSWIPAKTAFRKAQRTAGF